VRIKINYNNYLIRKITKKGSEILCFGNIGSVNDVINCLIKDYGIELENFLFDAKSRKLKIMLLVNGISVSDLNYKLSDNDDVSIFTFVTGG
jgi:molybdopterin converting factor small subunit